MWQPPDEVGIGGGLIFVAEDDGEQDLIAADSSSSEEDHDDGGVAGQVGEGDIHADRRSVDSAGAEGVRSSLWSRLGGASK